MIPDIDTQLASVIKSIGDNIAPAVDSANQLAQEQLQLSLATLNIIRQHLPHVHAYARKDISEHVELSGELINAATDLNTHALESVKITSNSALKDPSQSSDALLVTARVLRAAITTFLSENAELTQFDTIVLKFSKQTIDRGRAWNVLMGFEPDASVLPTLEETL